MYTFLSEKVRIIPYQEQIGNYNFSNQAFLYLFIIPYQEQIGNYNSSVRRPWIFSIIPYQEQIGNYNQASWSRQRSSIIPYQEQIGNYNVKGFPILKSAIIPYQEQIGNYKAMTTVKLFFSWFVISIPLLSVRCPAKIRKEPTKSAADWKLIRLQRFSSLTEPEGVMDQKKIISVAP